MSTVHISPLPHYRDGITDLGEYLRQHRATLTRSDLEYLSQADGLGQAEVGRLEYEPKPAYLEVAIGGHLVTAKPSRPAGMTDLAEPVGGLRGLIIGFSRQSRTRLIRMIARTEKDKRPLFVTLTYPDLFDRDKKRWKRNIDVIGKRFRRKFPDAAMIWRIEFKERKSGQNQGEIAPHYHLLIWGVDHYHLREWLPSAWYDVVASGDEKHLKAGTSSERVKTWNGVMSYVSKYLAKEDEYPLDWSGRVWGVIARENIPFAVVVRIALTDQEAVKLVRLGRKYLGLTGKTLIYGLTWLMDCERVLDYLEVLQGFT